MNDYEWPAKDYAIGSYIQATIADQYLNLLATKPDDHILDIGCGDGAYTTKILERVPKGTVMGIDRSNNMLQLAREKMARYPHFTVQQMSVLLMDFDEQFDYITSFWCLHWCDDLATAYMNIYRALKKGGKILTIFPDGHDPVMTTLEYVKSTHQFPELEHFEFAIDFQKVGELPTIMAALPFKNARVEIRQHAILLPSLDIFRKFIYGLALFNGRVPQDKIGLLNDAMVEAFDLECQQKYQGEYWFNASIFVVMAEK